MTDVTHVGSGKVRELFEVGDELLLVASDRISAYDVVLDQPIPDKGKVLTGLSHYWFEVMDGVCPNHLISIRAEDLPDVGMDDLGGRAMLCKKAEPIAIEFVVRGYLSGSGWKEYKASGEVCGHKLPEGLVESDRLPEPILTPATKAVTGHDENITEAQAAEVAGKEVYDTARSYALAVYQKAAELAAGRGVIIADTKFEFGIYDGEVILIDEVLTPDSSRFWPADTYKPGGSQPSFDKQYVRDWLDTSGWDHNPPAPQLPPDVVAASRDRYIEAYEKVSGRPFDSWLKEVSG
ncbi:MAG: phosphoribosylaminoimidazole-succinocarboxamide synthase [Actinomycetota bacterium]|jgi:phosphoribosylaminoimidazole-succinocarboxamide synthase|nr:phosphoribosylaminoimidazole-succinocarboxamide synthase [Actinomycetota bacterium]